MRSLLVKEQSLTHILKTGTLIKHKTNGTIILVSSTDSTNIRGVVIIPCKAEAVVSMGNNLGTVGAYVVGYVHDYSSFEGEIKLTQ